MCLSLSPRLLFLLPTQHPPCPPQSPEPRAQPRLESHPANGALPSAPVFPWNTPSLHPGVSVCKDETPLFPEQSHLKFLIGDPSWALRTARYHQFALSPFPSPPFSPSLSLLTTSCLFHLSESPTTKPGVSLFSYSVEKKKTEASASCNSLLTSPAIARERWSRLPREPASGPLSASVPHLRLAPGRAL